MTSTTWHTKGMYLWLEIRKTIYGLPQAGILANKQLREKLQHEVAHMVHLDCGDT